MTKEKVSGTQLGRDEIVDENAVAIEKLERNYSELKDSMAEMLRLFTAFAVKHERADPPAREKEKQTKLDIEDLEDEVEKLKKSSAAGPGKAKFDPAKLKKSMFLDISYHEEDGEEVADKFGEVARALGKELKAVGNTSSKKKKLKSAPSFILWEKRFRKRLRLLTDLDAVSRYLDFVGTVSFIARHESWSVARSYAWEWLKLDARARSVAEKGGADSAPDAGEISNALLMKAKLKAAKVVKSDASGRKKGTCYACGATGHWASSCTVPCAKCGVVGHNAQRCFRGNEKSAQGGAQQGASANMGGPALHTASPSPASVCSKCRQTGHTAAQCHHR